MIHCCLLLGLLLCLSLLLDLLFCLSFHVQSSGKIFTNLWVLEKRQTWRQDSRHPKIHAVFPLCNFITLLLSGPTLAKKTAGIFNNICFVSAKVTYAHNKKHKHYQRAYNEKQAYPTPLPALLLRGKSFQWLLLGVPSVSNLQIF